MDIKQRNVISELDSDVSPNSEGIISSLKIESNVCASHDASNIQYANMTDDEKIDFVAARVLREYRRAFEELAK